MKIGKFNKKNVKIFSKYFLQRISFFFLLIILVTFLLAINSITSRISLKAGEVAPRDITSTETVEFVNKAATEKLKEEAIKSTPEVYNLNLVSIESVDEELYGFFREIKELRNEYNLLIEQQLNDNNESETAITEEFINYKSRLLTDRYSFNSESTIANLLKLDEISLEEVEHNVNHSINKVMQQGIKENDLEEAKKQIIRDKRIIH